MTKAELITAQVREEFLEHIRDFQKYGPDYIAQYVESVVDTQTIRRPKMLIHPKLAALVRELVLDAAVMDRGLAAKRPPTPSLPPRRKVAA